MNAIARFIITGIVVTAILGAVLAIALESAFWLSSAVVAAIIIIGKFLGRLLFGL